MTTIARALALLLPLLLVLSPQRARADEASIDEEPKERYFYKGYDYGSQALFSPAYVIVNRGFDVIQTRVDSRNIFELSYKQNAVNVATNLANPVKSITEEGWGRFLTQEIFPLSFKQRSARWVPNYTLHLIGGGVTYTTLREWYEDKQWPAPAGMAALTVLATAFINETIENKEVTGRNTDAIADFYFFDIGGILLFNLAPINKFFSKHLIIADWSPPPALVYPDLKLHNHGNNFAAKLPLPFYPKLSLFSYFGLSSTGGLSYKFDGEYAISAAAGARSTRLLAESTTTVHNNVQFAPTAGVFLDRNNSLLASLVVSNVQDYFINANVFPGAIKALPGVGLWAVLDRHFNPIVGLSTSIGFGMGVGK